MSVERRTPWYSKAYLTQIFARRSAQLLAVIVFVVVVGLLILVFAAGSETTNLPLSGGTLSGTSYNASNATVSLQTAGNVAHRYLYVAVVGGIYIYDIDNNYAQTGNISLPSTAVAESSGGGVRGVEASAQTGMLYVSHGSDKGPGSPGYLLEYSLTQHKIIYDKNLGTGIDHMALTPDGRTIYMPDGELSTDGTWNIVDAITGTITGHISAGKGPHNTTMSGDGTRVFLGGRNYGYLYVVSTATNQVISRVGPMSTSSTSIGVRPLTTNGKGTISYNTVTDYRGFMVGDVATGQIRYRVNFGSYAQTSPTAPSHGVSLSPDEKTLYVIDYPTNTVRIYDVSGGLSSAPVFVRSVAVASLAGSEAPCVYDCARDGWVGLSRQGDWAFVGDAGTVFNTSTFATKQVPQLTNSRKFIEIDTDASGNPVDTTQQEGVGEVF